MVPPRLGDDDDAIVSIVPVPIKDLGISPHGGSFFPPIPTLSAEERSRFVFSAVAPNLLIGLEADYIFWFILLPVDVGNTVVKWAYCVPKNVVEMENFERVLELVHRSVEAFNDEDFPINAGMQRGMRSRLATRGRMSVEENTTAQVAQWLIQRYRVPGPARRINLLAQPRATCMTSATTPSANRRTAAV